jgi:hypothetical protein
VVRFRSLLVQRAIRSGQYILTIRRREAPRISLKVREATEIAWPFNALKHER